MNSPDLRLAQQAGSRRRKGSRAILLRMLRQLRGAGLTLQEMGNEPMFFGDETAPLQGQIEVQDLRVYRRVLLGGSIAAGESYIDGDWTTPNLTVVLQLLAENLGLVDKIESKFSWLTSPVNSVVHFFRNNSPSQARKNISAHYDLGNDFYQGFLDERMLYSSAWYQTPHMTLEQAQEAKMRRLCEQLQLRAEDHLLEIGTGWGAMAEFAAREYGCQVTTTTISREQYDFACQRIEKAGLTERVTVLFEDYRALRGQYDKLVSIEMIEAVGKRYLPTFFKRCNQLLKPKGRMAIQAITIVDQRYKHYSRNVDFIQRYVFPGGFLPSINAMTESMTRHTALVVRDLFDIGNDYARTLYEWRERVQRYWSTQNAQYNDERFRRLWVFYLCYCEAGFRARTISTVQLVAERQA
ncbi:cyclopropane-fatty-acyl-phospholipid synthase family protein [Rouxiella badensis]|jgi:cyclopropane-fatty-acyl-phospholipid synthase|uniref:SAM-dependent methyltransferase n=2 Tax=Rouxiella badensis TaxID=1646377 RepID=A0A1X0WKT0_9GAMM|nr:cyclopropane-fatty-acyl-phospholipid synthase family protein [Rouxiella badensis]MCC3701031.1 cyclopropane-fatty-acyl-phospholipid synthase family protein [Rouxiella badensis]MCC3717458.1 cyclopropane-fatty-acyl-phospholipid synthase family protein [Rouxiella badensis]MCC3727598.1 cyclopropane-fatty-acyl-phospholipid synthase family protein [Rouxiella badensis]MCC3732458.1 cyclopropane-fatty-acyl-phospholipid synthase family protein [Rouxiella badensis]MCC3740430.1 cyclopropane-fatty-acyl-p